MFVISASSLMKVYNEMEITACKPHTYPKAVKYSKLNGYSDLQTYV